MFSGTRATFTLYGGTLNRRYLNHDCYHIYKLIAFISFQ